MEKSNISINTSRDFIRPIFRHKLLILISFVIISVITYIILLMFTNVYEAKVLIHIKGIGQIEAQTYERLVATRIHFTQMSIVTSNPVMKRAVKALELDKRPLDYETKFCHSLKVPLVKWQAFKTRRYIDGLSPELKQHYRFTFALNALKTNTTTTLRPNTDIFEISVKDYDPASAVAIANVVSRSFIIYDLEQQLVELEMKYGDLHPTILQLQDNIYKMKNNLTGNELSDMDAYGTASVKIIEQASTNYLPVGKPKILIFLGGIIFALVFGVGLAMVVDIYSNSFKSPQDFVDHFNLPVIGTIPKRIFFQKNKIGIEKSSEMYESFMSDLADQMFIFMKIQKLKVLLFASANPVSSNSTITSNLGYHLAGMGINVLVIDANITKPVVDKLLNINESPGLGDIIKDDSRKIEEIIISKDANISFMPVGASSKDIMSLLSESKLKTIFKYCKNKYDAVLIDCTLVSKMSDMAMLFSNADGVVVIANEGTDHLQATKKTIYLLKKYNANIVGGVLNNRTFPIPDWLYKRM
ncbi:MAG: AAA family ATPase [Spirochaetes bacterium]|nr:AAA family ATPase [Spirochaetota bacterium]